MNGSLDNVKCDIAIVGGGLSGGLAALALAKMRPELSIVLIDGQESYGGNHIWSYFASDIDTDNRWLTAPLVTCGWSGYDVHFPQHSRTLDNIYYSIESERLHEILIKTLPASSVFLNSEVKSITPRLVVLKGGRRINAGGVIDARGGGDVQYLDCGWQKFTGHMLQLEDPHELRRPIIKDATVTQYDGYRFVYALPFSMDKLFIEDTYYSDTPDLDTDIMDQRLQKYASDAGWNVREIIRRESGVLPVVMGGNLDKYWASGSSRTAKIGARGGFFHSVTSYTLPDAVRMAIFIAKQNDFDGDRLNSVLRKRANDHWANTAFYRNLNKMLFRASEPQERYKVLERFYKLNPGLISRFYAGKSTAMDKAKILSGKPPVPIGKAIKALMGSSKK